jgi:AraC-like DNA-binding protein
MDKLSDVLSRFSVSAGVFYSGALCGLVGLAEAGSDEGHLHLLKRGRLEVMDSGGEATVLEEPSLVFFPRPTAHRLMAEEADQAEIVCASIRYGTGSQNPLAHALPSRLVLPLGGLGRLQATIEWLFDEAFAENSGRQMMMDRLTEVLLIQLLRHVVDTGLMTHGMLAGLAHPQLSHAIRAMHANPAKAWPLDELSALCAMSRSKFAEEFKRIVGNPPGDYLIEWRVSVAQGLLKKGKPVGWIANEVGYENASALARVFRKKTGLSPREWLLRHGAIAIGDD